MFLNIAWTSFLVISLASRSFHLGQDVDLDQVVGLASALVVPLRMLGDVAGVELFERVGCGLLAALRLGSFPSATLAMSSFTRLRTSSIGRMAGPMR
jgi:hypothetical protein